MNIYGANSDEYFFGLITFENNAEHGSGFTLITKLIKALNEKEALDLLSKWCSNHNRAKDITNISIDERIE